VAWSVFAPALSTSERACWFCVSTWLTPPSPVVEVVPVVSVASVVVVISVVVDPVEPDATTTPSNAATRLNWGMLDRVWQLHHQLKTGDVYALTQPDRELLVSAMARHPALAEALLAAGHIGIISAQRDGWIDTPEVTIIRTPRALSTRLAESGFKSETWHPAASSTSDWQHAAEPSKGGTFQDSNTPSRQQHRESDGGGQQQPKRPQEPVTQQQKGRNFAWLMSSLR